MRYFSTAILILALSFSLAGAKSVELTSAQIYFSQGEYHKAIEFYEKAVADLEPKYAEAKAEGKHNKGVEKDLCTAYFEIGQCYKELQNYEKMSMNFDKSLEIDDKKYYNKIYDIREDLWIKFFNEGVPLFNEHNYQTAFDKFNMAVIIDPTNIQGYRQRGMCYIQLDKSAEAVKDFETFLEMEAESGAEQKDLAVRVSLANIYFKEYTEIMTKLAEMEADSIAMVEPAELKSLKAEKERYFDKAVSLYKKSLELDPDNISVLSRIAVMYQEMGREKEAIGMYQEALKKSPDNSDLYFNMGILYFHMDDYKKAAECFNKVVELNPGDVESIMNLVNSFWRAELYAQAIPYLEQVVELDPENLQAWSFLNVAYVKQSANENLDNAIRIEYLHKAQKAFDKYKELKGEE